MARLMGSSPLTRGKRISLFNDLSQIRLIPAHAGKTGLKPPKTSRDTAHPRSRGENTQAFEAAPEAEGSSPLTRGKHGLRRQGQPGGRLIPAHAGKTLMGLSVASRARAHPRSRGENVDTARDGCASQGSSPLTRGKLFTSFALRRINRLIPAHAGKTLPCSH